ncbi:ceramidase [Blastocladiella britannica]|nr:ceramidase [Blastocladiella britannica]
MQPFHNSSASVAHHTWETNALVDWCEDNFAVVAFIAEFVNTLSNFWYLVFSAFGMYNAIRYRYEKRFFYSYFMLFVVGIGSALFHGTLTYYMQLLDEVPMLFGSAIFIYCCYSPSLPRPPRWLVAVLTIYPTVATSWYFYHRVAEFFQNAYVVEVVAITVLNTVNRKYFTQAKRVEQLPRAASAGQGRFVDAIPSSDADPLFFVSLVAYLSASAFWVADNLLCYSHLLPLKEAVGYPLRFLLEFHGWWHLLSGLGMCPFLLTFWR